ncbi:MAG: heme o synthase [Alphaproteobacteria bacterium]
MSESSIAIAGRAPDYAAPLGDYIVLLKPRVMSLVVFTGFAGMIVAPGHIHPFLAVIAVLCIAVGAGASGAINMWYERDLDSRMDRTMRRPLPMGRMAPGDALGFGVVLAVGAVLTMGLAVNYTAAALLTLTICFYVFIYTIWLKRRTPQNIVIGGAAGAFPPMIGWAAVTGDVSLTSLALFAIIFMWTPPHFWALSLFRSTDYARAGVPMLPVVAGKRETKKHIVLYTLLLVPVTLVPAILGTSAALYGVAAVLLGFAFLGLTVKVWFDGTDKSAKQLFGFSILYLFLIFVMLIADHFLGPVLARVAA